jgi:hypothetical protein
MVLLVNQPKSGLLLFVTKTITKMAGTSLKGTEKKRVTARKAVSRNHVVARDEAGKIWG